MSRGFRGHRSEDVEAGRVPPGHYVTPDFPVLSAGSTPHDAIERWSFEIRGEGRPDRCRAHRWAHGWQDIRVTAAAEGQDLFPPRPIAMSRRLLQRRQFDQSVRERLIDEAFARYLDWLAESEAVKAAYGVWSRAARTDGAVPFAAYRAALDREERAANVYRSVIDQVEQLFGGEERLAGARPGAARA